MSTRPSPFEAANCLGKHDYFDSPSHETHQNIRHLCTTCPALAACEQRRAEILADPTARLYAEGTWAGMLLRGKTEQKAASRARRKEAAA